MAGPRERGRETVKARRDGTDEQRMCRGEPQSDDKDKEGWVNRSPQVGRGKGEV